MKKRLYVDMDGVLVDFYSGVSRLDDATRAAYADDPKNAPGVFALMDPIPGAVDAINRLADKFDWDKHGTSDFQGKWIRFGSPEFPDWDAVEAYLA